MKIKDLIVGERYVFGGGLVGTLAEVRVERACWNSRLYTAPGNCPTRKDGCKFVDVRCTFDIDRGVTDREYDTRVVPVAKVERLESDRIRERDEAQARLDAHRFATERAMRLAEHLTEALDAIVHVQPAEYGKEAGIVLPLHVAQALLAAIDAGGPLAKVEVKS